MFIFPAIFFYKTVFSLHTTLYSLLWFWIFLYISVGDVERSIQSGLVSICTSLQKLGSDRFLWNHV